MIEKSVEYDSFPELPKIEKSSFQRNIDRDHVERMKNNIRSYHLLNKKAFIGTILIAYFNGDYYIIDGQHRYTALKELNDEFIWLKIFTHEVQVDSYKEMEDIFTTIHMNKEVPDYIKYQDQRQDILFRTICDWLESHKYFVQRDCNRPNINLNTFTNKLRESKLFSVVKSLKDFQRIYKYINMISKNKLETGKKMPQGVTSLMKEKMDRLENWISFDKNYEFLNVSNMEIYKKILSD